MKLQVHTHKKKLLKYSTVSSNSLSPPRITRGAKIHILKQEKRHVKITAKNIRANVYLA